MHIHVPKPLHGWKAFFNEILVIMIGILLALGFEALVEAAHWRHKVAEGEERLKVELQRNYAFAAVYVAARPCVVARLATLQSRVLAEGERLAPVAPLSGGGLGTSVVELGRRPFGFTIWESLVADGTAAHMPQDRQRDLAAVYTLLGFNRAAQIPTTQTMDHLRVLTLPIALDAETRLNLLQQIGELRGRLEIQRNQMAGSMRLLQRLGFAAPAAMVARELEESGRTGIMRQCALEQAAPDDWRSAVAETPARTQQE